MAILAGCVFIIIVILTMQLAFIFIAVAYNALAKLYPMLNEITGIFRYLIGVPVFVAVMFAGGYITAMIAGDKPIDDVGNTKDNAKSDATDKAIAEKHNVTVWPHCITVGLITAGAMLFSALQNSSLTTTGFVVFFLAVTATTAGGQYWLKRS